MADNYAVALKDITFSYGDNRVLSGFNLNIQKGKTYALVGSSGSGKTTALRLINGLLQPNQGQILIDGKPFDFTNAETWRRSMGYSIQGSGLFPHMTLRENLSIIAQKEKWSGEKIDQRIAELCHLMTLPGDAEFLRKKPREISGGQQQRVGIARALFMNPKIMLMDEPFSALDPITRSELQKEFMALQKKLQLTIVLVTHDLPEAFSMANEMVLLNKGKIEQKGKPSKFLLAPNSPFVESFMKSHSPGNLLKEIYLYSVVESDIYVVSEHESGLTLENLDTGHQSSETSLVDAKAFLKSKGQSTLYWVDNDGKFIKSQDENLPETIDCVASTDHILSGMSKILSIRQSTLPVVSENGLLIGVLSQGALDAL